MSENETKDLVESKPVALMAMDGSVPEGSWGTQEFSASDILISKLLLQQALSELVNDGKTKPGDMADSVTGEVLAPRGEMLEIIPICMTKTWRLFKQEKNKFEFERIEPCTASNENLPYEFQEGADLWRRDKCFNLHLLLTKNATKPETLPLVVTFSRTSSNVGRFVATHFMKMQMAKRPPAHQTLVLYAHQEQGDLGAYFVFKIKEGRETTKEELAAAYRWFNLLKAANVRVDDVEERKTETPRDDQASQAIAM